MRRSLLLALPLAAALVPSPSGATTPSLTGGAPGSGAETGGAAFDARTLEPLRVRTFSVTPGTVAAGTPVRVVVRVDGRAPEVRLRLDLLAGGTRRLVRRIPLGEHHTGRRVTARWRGSGRALAPGVYTARLHAIGPDGQRLRHAARKRLRITAPPPPVPTAPPPAESAPPPVPEGRFPVQGPYTFGGPEGRFGAERPGHPHTGQDIVAAEGTPVFSPLSGVVTERAFQAEGAGHYLVVRARDGRDFAFMHLREGSLQVAKGETVSPDRQIAEVGTTGRSTGPHLHFEIWIGGWWEAGGHAIDPLPQLEAWARGGT